MPLSKVPAAALASGAARGNFGAGAVLQVVQSVISPIATSLGVSETLMASTEGALAASLQITPSSSSSRILVFASTAMGGGAASHFYAALFRDSTNMTQRGFYTGSTGTGTAMLSMSHLDIPVSSATITYSLRFGTNNTSTTQYLGRYYWSSSSGDRAQGQLIAMEIAG